MPVDIEKSKSNCAELMERVLELQNQHQELTDRVNHRVMEAATRIREDRAELMQYKEDMERLEAQKRNFERNSTERLLQMENGLRRTSHVVEIGNAYVPALEVRNSYLERDKEAVKSSASDLATRLDEVLAQGKKNKEMIESQEKLKISYAKDLEDEKRKSISLKDKVEEAEALNHRLEAMLNQEIKEKEGLVLEAGEVKKERERRQNEWRQQLSRIPNQQS